MENLSRISVYFITVSLTFSAVLHSAIAQTQRQFGSGSYDTSAGMVQTGNLQQQPKLAPECGIQDIKDDFDFHAAAPWAAALFYVEGDFFSNNLKQEYLSSAVLLSRNLAITSSSRHLAQQKTGLESNLQILYGHRRAAKQTFLRIKKVEPLAIRPPQPLALKVDVASMSGGRYDREAVPSKTQADNELYLLHLESPVEITSFSRPVCVNANAFQYKTQYKEARNTKKLHLSGYAARNESSSAQHGVFFSPDSEWRVKDWDTDTISVITGNKQLTYDMLPKHFKPGSALTFKMNHQFFLVGILLKTTGSETVFRSLEKYVEMIHFKQNELSPMQRNPITQIAYGQTNIKANSQNNYYTTNTQPQVPVGVANDQSKYLQETEKSEFDEGSPARDWNSGQISSTFRTVVASVLTEGPDRYSQVPNQQVQPSTLYQSQGESQSLRPRPQVEQGQYGSQQQTQYVTQPQQTQSQFPNQGQLSPPQYQQPSSSQYPNQQQQSQPQYGTQPQKSSPQYGTQPQFTRPQQSPQSQYDQSSSSQSQLRQPQQTQSQQQGISQPIYYPPGHLSEPERPQIYQQNHATCTQTYTEGVDIECISRPRGITSEDCIKRAPANTTIRLSCKNHYVPLHGEKVIEQTCDAHGKWLPRISFGCRLDCGTIKQSIPYIVKGSETLPEKWPWHAALFKSVNETNFSYICGATLITRSILVTAAHCVHDGANRLVNKNLFRVVVGAISSNLLINRNDPEAQEYSIREIRVNEHYSPRNYEADIALLQISKSVRLTDYVRPVCYPGPGNDNKAISNYQLSEGSKGVVVGFGTTHEDNGISKTLRLATLPYVSVRNCTNVLQRRPLSTQYCAGYTNGTSVCEGDSGGAQVFEDTNTKRYFIQGIISHGNRKDTTIGKSRCDNEKYTVFTKVGAFTEWMQDVIYKIDLDYNRRRRKRSLI